MSTEITVRGAFSAFRPAERGTVHTTVAYEGPDMEPVYARVATDLAQLKSSVIALEEQGAVTWWSADHTHLVEPTLEQRRQAASARPSRECRRRSEIS